MIAALFVETDGCYFGLPGVDAWDEKRDARLYAGPWPVVAHPDCKRWGRFWHGSTRKPHQFKLGDDGGCFEAAFRAVNKFGGVLEHPADSHAWRAFGILKPERGESWIRSGDGWSPVARKLGGFAVSPRGTHAFLSLNFPDRLQLHLLRSPSDNCTICQQFKRSAPAGAPGLSIRAAVSTAASPAPKLQRC